MKERFEKLAGELAAEGGPETHGRAFRMLGFEDPGKAAALWRRLLPPNGAGPPPVRLVAHLLCELSSCPDPDMALLNIGRIADARVSPARLLDSVFMERPLCHLLVVIASCSYFLSDILARSPGYLSWLMEADTLGPPKSFVTYREELALAILPFTDRRRRINAVKRHQRRELLRIGARDLLGLAGVEEATAELSFLADAVIETVAGLAFELEAAAAGLPIAGDEAAAEGEGDRPYYRFAVISLGKLGGTELNYSSDIDLLFICGETGDAGERAFYTALAQRITNDLSESTEDGILYRTDLRLRPDGESGPLVVTPGEHLNFLMRRARPWERQALIKARRSTGSCSLSQIFLDNCARVVFGSLSGDDMPGEILTMRERAVALLPDRERTGNIKLMSGGIRDIEFITQALQLAHGVHRPEVRSRNTLETLERLHHYGKIGDDIRTSLEGNYRFYRTVEHRLQLLRNVRTHTLPEGDVELARLGKRMAHGSLEGITGETFAPQLGAAIRRTQSLFDEFFRKRAGGSIPLLLALPPGESKIEGILSRYGIDDGGRAVRFIHSLVYGDFPRLEGAETLHAAARCLPPILERIAGTPDPSLTLKNLVRIVKATGAVRSTLELLAGGGDLLRLLLVLASLSSDLSEVTARRIGLLDGLAEGTGPGETPEPDKDLVERLAEGRAFGEGLPEPTEPPHDTLPGGRALERHLDSLRRWYEESLVHIHCMRPIPESGPEIIGPLISALSARAVRALFDLSGCAGTGVTIVALGSLAACELRFGSDIDLVAVMDDGGDQEADTAAVRRMVDYGRRIGLGSLDLRLRGEGEGSQLVQTLGRYRGYFERRASFWERLAYLKAGFVCGDDDIRAAFAEILGAILSGMVETGDIPGKMIEERRRLESLSRGAWDVKHAPGGLYDIDFLVMTLEIGRLSKTGGYPLLRPVPGGAESGAPGSVGPGDEATTPSGREAPFTLRGIEHLRLGGILNAGDAETLRNAHSIFYLAPHAAALHGVAYPPLPERERFLDSYLSRLLAGRLPGEGSFTRKLESVRNRVRDIFHTYIE